MKHAFVVFILLGICSAYGGEAEKPKEEKKIARDADGFERNKEGVIVLHKGDKMPPVGVPYCFENDEAERDYAKRLREFNAAAGSVLTEVHNPRPKCKTG